MYLHDAAVQTDLGMTDLVSTEEAQQMMGRFLSMVSDRTGDRLLARFEAQLAKLTAEMHDTETKQELAMAEAKMFEYKFIETNIENEHLEQRLQETLMEKSVPDSEGVDDAFDCVDTEGRAPGDFGVQLVCRNKSDISPPTPRVQVHQSEKRINLIIDCDDERRSSDSTRTCSTSRVWRRRRVESAL